MAARAVPFGVFVVLTALQGTLGPDSKYWLYVLKTAVGACLIFIALPYLPELKWKISWEAVAAGVLVFALWVGLNPLYPKLPGSSNRLAELWNPFAQYGYGGYMAIGIAIFRILGSTIIVPPIEELFYRSFLYRYMIQADFLAVPLGRFNLRAFLVSSLVFGLAHHEWLAGVLCGCIYQALVCYKNRLGDALTAHAVTNFLLGLWVIWKGAWQFW